MGINRFLILFVLMASCAFFLGSPSLGWSSEQPRTAGKESAFTPFELAQLAPGRVKILEGEPEQTGGSKLQFSDNKLKQAGFILSGTVPVGAIIKNLGTHETFAIGEIVYIDIGTEHGVKKGDLLAVFSRDRLILHPVLKGDMKEGILNYERPLGEEHPTYFSRVGKKMGHLVYTLGYLEILEPTQGSSKAIIRASYNPMKNGDYVTPYVKPIDPPRRPEAQGEQTLSGYVLAFNGDHYLGGLNDIVYIDLGKKNHVLPGDRFEVYVTPTKEEKYWYEANPKGAALIPHVIGELQVLDVQEETATTVVTASSFSIPLGAPIRYKPVDLVSPPLNDVLALQNAPSYELEEQDIPVEKSFAPIAEEEPFADLEPSLFGEEQEVEDAKLLSFIPSLELTDVHFHFDRDDLDDISRQALQKNAEYLLQHPNVKVQIEGHCDERGTNNYNLALGERRALSVKNFMMTLGVEENRMSLISYGEEKPYCQENNEHCWQQNRRVHFLAGDSSPMVN